MNILISCALPIEFNEARNQLGLKETTTKRDKPRVASGKNITLICTGPGKINTALSLYKYLLNTRFDLVIDTGTCGTLSDRYKPLDIVTSTSAIDFFTADRRGDAYDNLDLDTLLGKLPALELGHDIIASVEESVIHLEQKESLLKSGASIVTWESSTLFAICSREQIPFLSIRGVTDCCNGETFKDFKINSTPVCKKLYNYVKFLCIGI